MLKGTFKKKRKQTISEAAANKAGSKQKASVIRVGDKAIVADPAQISQIKKYLKKREEKQVGIKRKDSEETKIGKRYTTDYVPPTIEEVIQNVGVEGQDFRILDVVKENRDIADVVMVRDNLLRIDKKTAIQGTPALIKRAYEYIQANPSSISDIQSIIDAVDEPIVVSFNPVEEEAEQVLPLDNPLWRAAPMPEDEDIFYIVTEQSPTPSDEESQKRVKRLPKDTRDKEVLPQLHIVNMEIGDELVGTLSEEELALQNMNLRQKYYALGEILKGAFSQDLLDKVEKKRQDIADLVNLDLPRSTSMDGFEDFSKRRPALSTKFNIFNDTVYFTDSQGKQRVRKSGKTQPTFMAIETKQLHLDDQVTRKLRDYITAEMISAIDGVYNGEIKRVERMELHETKENKYEAGKMVTLVDGRTVNILREGETYVEILDSSRPEGNDIYYVLKSRIVPEEEEEIQIEVEEAQEERPDIVDVGFVSRREFFENRIKTLSLSGQIVPLRDVHGEKAADEFEAALDHYKNETNLRERDATLFLLAAIIEWNFNRLYPSAFAVVPFNGHTGFFNDITEGPAKRREIYGSSYRVTSTFEVDLQKHFQKNITRLISETKLKELEELDSLGRIDPTKLDRVVLMEIVNFVRNHPDLDYREFLVLPDLVWPSDEQIQMIAQEWAQIQESNNAHVEDFIVVDVVPGLEGSKNSSKQEVQELEYRIFEKYKNVGEYIIAVSNILQYVSNMDGTVGPYAQTFKERILIGDISIASLQHIDAQLALPEFSLNDNLDLNEFTLFVDRSRAIVANHLMNVWAYTQTLKMSDNVWFRLPKTRFDPSKSLVDVGKMCGMTENTVFVKVRGKIVCKPRSEVAENIERYERSNADEIRDIVAPVKKPIEL